MKIVFQKSGHLSGTVSVETVYGCHSSESVANCCVVGRTPGDTRDGLDRARSSRTLALEAISCKIYRHCRNINSAGRELELVALTKTNLSRDQVMPTKRAKIAPRYPTPALEKGLDILELLANHPTGLTKSEVPRSLHRTVSEIFRMMVALQYRRFIHQASAVY